LLEIRKPSLSPNTSKLQRTNKIFIVSIIFITTFVFNSAYLIQNYSTEEYKYSIHPLAGYNFKQLRDTVYTEKENYIEVNLLTQHATLFSRDGSKFHFPISSGNKWIEDGMETNQGLFAIHWKAKKRYSAQFDSTALLNWMNFNNGIGFHALEGKSYYKYLGKKNVSHGCVRVSREDAQFVYDNVERGTPVLVYKGNIAITVAFTSEGESYSKYSYSKTYQLFKKRFQLIYDGDYLISSNEKLLVDEKNIYSDGLPIGDSELIPTRQNLKPNYLWVDKNKSEEKRLAEIFSGKEKFELTLNPFLDSKN